MLQRMFKIGFNRAARIMDQLAEAGVVGEEEGTKPRKVLMTMEEFDQIYVNPTLHMKREDSGYENRYSKLRRRRSCFQSKRLRRPMELWRMIWNFTASIRQRLTDELWQQVKDRPDGKLVLVTAINPTPAGEGKTTTSIGLADALTRLGKKTMIALREPSLGPCFGIKGGAAGGGFAQVVPMEDLNLHFTGDFHAITSANNLLAALLDNHIQQGNALQIDTRQILWKRCLDMNDRVLRNIVVGLGAKADGVVREDHFVITVASEIMAILCLANDMNDLKNVSARSLLHIIMPESR